MPTPRARSRSALLILAVCAAPHLEAQVGPIPVADTAASVTGNEAPSTLPIPRRFITPFLSAGWSQTLGTPNAWKRTWGGYGSRVGDQFGFLVVGQSVRRLVDHAVPWVDDRSPCVASPLSRTREVVVRAGCAIERTSTLRTTSGAMRPNLPLLVGAAVGSLTSLSWRPERQSATAGRAYVAQRMGTTYGVAVLVRLVTDWRADANARR